MSGEAPYISRIDHVQITIPVGAEDEARRFYCGVLGLAEIAKPATLADRGGFWCRVGDLQLHIGTEDGGDRTTTKAHIAYSVEDIALWRDRLSEAGFEVLDPVSIPGYERFETRDPYGNRIEFIQRSP